MQTNTEYWQNLASTIAPGEDRTDRPIWGHTWNNLSPIANQQNEGLPVPPLKHKGFALEYFQKAIAMVILNQTERANRFFTKSMNILLEKMSINPESSDYMMFYIAKWLITDLPPKIVLLNSIKNNEREVFEKLIIFGQKDLYHLTDKYLNMDRSFPLLKVHMPYFIEESPLVRPYRETAAHMLTLSRRQFLFNKYNRSLNVAKTALELCRKASEKILPNMVEENKEWAPLLEKPETVGQLPPKVREVFDRQSGALAGTLKMLGYKAKIMILASAVLSGERASIMGLQKEFEERNKKSDSYQKASVFDGIEKEFKKIKNNPAGFEENVEKFVEKMIAEKQGELLGAPSGRAIDNVFAGLNLDSSNPLSVIQKGFSDLVDFFSGNDNYVKDTYFPAVNGEQPKEVLQDFFNQYINPPGRVKSYMDTLEEVEWCLVRARLIYRLETENISKYIQLFLG